MKDSFISLKIGRIRRAFRAEFERRAAALEITKSQYHVLSRLWRGDGVLSSNIARDIGMTTSTMTGVLDRLEAKKLIRRSPAADDRRAVEIWLTDEGKAVRRPLQKIIADINDKALCGFTERQRERFLAVLDKVGDNLENAK